LRDVWYFTKNFYRYKLHIEVEEWFSYEKDENESEVDSVIHELGVINNKGYHCKDKGLIKWDPGNNIPEYKEYLKKFNEIQRQQKQYQIDIRGKVEAGLLSRKDALEKRPTPWAILMDDKLRKKLKLYDNTFGILDAHEADLPEIEIKIDDWQVFYKINEVILILLYDRLEFLSENDEDFSDLRGFMLDAQDGYFYNPVRDDNFSSNFYFRIKASSGKIWELLVGADIEEWDILLSERTIKDGEYCPVEQMVEQHPQKDRNRNRKTRDTVIDEIEPTIIKIVQNKLKQHFGSEDWWMEGVPVAIRNKCSIRKNEDKSKEPESSFLDLIDQKDIILNNFNIFGNSFTMQGDEKNSKKEKLNWLVKTNKIRNKCSHGAREIVTQEELEFVKKIYEWLEGLN